MSRHLIGRKAKVITVYVVATRDGAMPATPRRDSKTCALQLELSRKYKPDVRWQVYEVIQVITGSGLYKSVGKIRVENASDEVEVLLIQQLKDRHGDVLRKLGMELDGNSDE